LCGKKRGNSRRQQSQDSGGAQCLKHGSQYTGWDGGQSRPKGGGEIGHEARRANFGGEYKISEAVYVPALAGGPGNGINRLESAQVLGSGSDADACLSYAAGVWASSLANLRFMSRV
jgi:hypothetical protein